MRRGDRAISFEQPATGLQPCGTGALQRPAGRESGRGETCLRRFHKRWEHRLPAMRVQRR